MVDSLGINPQYTYKLFQKRCICMPWKGGFSMKAGLLVLVLTALLVTGPAFGQALSPKKDFDDWNFYIAPYVYVVHMSGYSAMTSPFGGKVEMPVDLQFEELGKHWKYGFSGMIHLKKARWAFGLDLTFFELSKDQCITLPEPEDCDAEVKNTVQVGEHELFVGYQFNKSMPASDVILGIRYVNHDIKLEPKNGPSELNTSFGETFYVPFLGIRYYGPLGEDSKWSPFIRGDVGGLWTLTKLNWRFNFGISWLFAKHFDLSLQYKWKHDNYVKGEIGDSDYYRYDVTEHGPLLGLGIRF
jgi:hypothetical protein